MASRTPTYTCPVAQTANVLGAPWTAVLLRDLLQKGVCRYQELLDSLKGIAPNTLSERLKMLESNGIVERRFYEQHPPRAEYVITPKGRELGPIIRAMAAWGQKHGGGETRASLSPSEPKSQVKLA